MKKLTATEKAKLLDLRYKLQDILAADKSAVPGEAYHPGYKKDKEVFRIITNADMVLEKKTLAYFKQLVGRIKEKFNTFEYQSQIKKGSVLDETISIDWTDETLTMRVVLTDALEAAILAGGLLTEIDTGISVGWSTGKTAAIDFLNKYSLKLAGDLTDTTKNRIKKSLKLSIDMGESSDKATARLAKVIIDEKRAATIAHTESIRAFNEGRLQVGREIGAKKKQWSVTLNACYICGPINDQIVGIDKEFHSTGSGLKYQTAPAHPNCRCLVYVVVDK